MLKDHSNIQVFDYKPLVLFLSGLTLSKGDWDLPSKVS